MEEKKVLSKKYTDIKGLGKLKDTVVDTHRMSQRIGETFNPKWSIKKLEQKHVEFTSRIELERYPDTQIEAMLKFKKEFHKGDITATLLQTPKQIKEEGTAMKHCVAYYADECCAGRYLVYSFRKNGARISTLGLHVYGVNGEVVSFSQHYGHCNSTVKDAEELDFRVDILNDYKDKMKCRI